MGAETEVFKGVLQGECTVAVTAARTWDTTKRDASINGICSLEWVGTAYENRQSGFAANADSSVLCTSLITDVLDYHLFNMKAESFIEKAWNDHLAKTGTIDCKLQDTIKKNEE